MIKNYKSFLESIFWYDNGKLVPDPDNIPDRISDREYSPAEQWFLEQITDLEEFRKDKYPDSIFYKKNGQVLFEYEQKNGNFWCHYDKIWSVFFKKFGLNIQEIKELIGGMVEEHLNLRGVTPMRVNIFTHPVVEEHLNLRGVTPYLFKGIGFFRWRNI